MSKRRPLGPWKVTWRNLRLNVEARGPAHAVKLAWRALHRILRRRAAASRDEKELLRRLPQLRTDHETGGWKDVSVACV